MGKKKTRKQAAPEITQNEESLTGAWLHVVRALLASAMVITGYLAIVTLTNGGGAPGCGPDSGCDQVLTSPWAYWLGIPVSLPGLGLYAAFLISTFSLKKNNLQKARRSLNAQTLCAFSVIAAAIWFVGIQAFAIKAFCPYCCTAHSLATCASILFLAKANSVGSKLSVKLNFAGGAAMGAGLVGVIAVIQIAVPKQQAAPQIVDLGTADPTPSNTAPEPTPVIPESPASKEPIETIQLEVTEDVTPAPIRERPVSKPLLIPRTDFTLATTGLPTLGDLEAPNRITVIFDYTCHHCRQLHGFVRELLVKYEGQLSCLMIPMPLDANCNRLMKKTPKDHVNACEYAKICLAVHQVAPEKYDAFDTWLFSDHESVKTVPTVLEHAKQWVGSEKLIQALQSNQVQEQLKTNITTYETTSKMGRKSSMPQTIIGSQIVFGPPPNVEALDNILKQTLKLK
ncbi:MAG: vitamin K epoxide reductase family protein [Verrucomicrobia bacterium]|nr:vitamin K epoxide reductase family protein [Verrucomicrobiota bacterium]